MSEFKRNTIKIAVNNLQINVFALISSIIIARSLLPEKQGLVILVLLIANLLGQFISPATQTATSYFINKEKIDKDIIGSVVLRFSLFSSIVFSMVILLSYYICGFDFGLSNQYFSTSATLLFSVLYLILILPRVNLVGILYAMEKYSLSNKINFFSEFIVMFFVILLYFLKKISIPNILISYSLAYFASLIISYIYLKKEGLNFTLRPKITYYIKFFKYSLPIYYTSIVQSLQQRGTTFLMGLILTLSDVGIFGIGYTIADKLNEIVKPVIVTHLPKAAQLSSLKKDDEVAMITSNILGRVSALFIIILPFFWLVTYYLLPILYSNQYQKSVTVAIILSVGVVFISLSKILNNVFSIYHKQHLNSISITIATVVNLSLSCAALFTGMGIDTIALILSLSYFLNLVMQLYFIRRYIKISLVVVPDFKWIIKQIKLKAWQ